MKSFSRKVFIVNSRADARGMERFKAAAGLFTESLKGCEIRYTEHAGHASEIAKRLSEDGTLIGSTDDMFVPWEGGVDGLLRPDGEVDAENAGIQAHERRGEVEQTGIDHHHVQ